MSEYKLVPVEPTDEMIKAGWKCYDAKPSFSVADMYAAMLAAAPAVSAEPVAWAVYNGVCISAVTMREGVANEHCKKSQMEHDLSGSLAAFNVRPLYLHPPAPAVADKLAEALREIDDLAKNSTTIIGFAGKILGRLQKARAALAEYDQQRGGE